MKNLIILSAFAAFAASQTYALETVAQGGNGGLQANEQSVLNARLDDALHHANANDAALGGLGGQLNDLDKQLKDISDCITTSCRTPPGLPPANKDVTIQCAVASGLNQTLGVVLADGRTVYYNYPWVTDHAADGITEIPHPQAPILDKFTSKPVAMVAYHGDNIPGFVAGPSITRTYNMGDKGFNIDSEDGTDFDYNDLTCTLSWK